MTKKILAVMIIAALGLSMLAGCGKKDDIQTDAQTQQTQQQDEAATEQQEPKDDAAAEKNTDEKSDNDEAPAEPIEMTTEEFEDLVDKFNNPQSDAEKEEARIKLEAVLKQMEQQQQ